MDYTIESRIAQLEYNLFVINTRAAAIQQQDGRYTTKYFPVSPFVIENMLINRGSLGCYQQGYKTDRIKWICFDFDCKDKEDPQVEKLYSMYVEPFLHILDNYKIGYLTEFSGRRGIHVWIVFDTIFPKEIGYQIVSDLKSRCNEISEIEKSESWGLDLFPATGSSKGNIVGKQVKLPLSFHQTGSRSFLFTGKFYPCRDFTSKKFLQEQENLLENCPINSLDNILERLKIVPINQEFCKMKYKKYDLLENISISISEAIEVLSETVVYRNIFMRMKKGLALPIDWTVLLGTFYLIDNSGKFVQELFSLFPSYDEEKTKNNIENLEGKYHPATFGYLYYLYDLEMEDDIKADETGLIFLLNKLNVADNVILNYIDKNEKRSYLDVSTTIEKEKKYLHDNDEVTNVLVFNELQDITRLDIQHYENIIQCIGDDKNIEFHPEGYRTYLRRESESKNRKLITLSSKDRIITTHLAIQLCDILRYQWNSYSYRVSMLSEKYIFNSWYSSWGLYLANIRSFLEVPYLSSYSVFYIDLKGFYDHVDFVSAYRTIKNNFVENGREQKKAEPIFDFLITYNDELMKSLNEGNRIGVPQGPAYARIIAEIFLDQVLNKILEDVNSENIHVYRYVDDIVVFCNPNEDAKQLYQLLITKFPNYGLHINRNKSKFFGSISNLNLDDREYLLHSDSFNYDLIEDEQRGVYLDAERQQLLRKFLMSNEFQIDSIGYIFGKKTIPEASEWYLKKYKYEILSSEIGRGSNFRKFYRYLLSDVDYMHEIMNQNDLKNIPIHSVNFSNFVHVLYLSVKEHEIDADLFYRIRDEYLLEIKDDISDNDDKTVVNALVASELEMNYAK